MKGNLKFEYDLNIQSLLIYIHYEASNQVEWRKDRRD
jgi:hypothetical protein